MRTVAINQPVPRHPCCFQNCSTVAGEKTQPGESRDRPRVPSLLEPQWRGMGKSLGKTSIVPQKCGYNFPGVSPMENISTTGPKHDISLRGLYYDTGSQEVLEPESPGRSLHLCYDVASKTLPGDCGDQPGVLLSCKWQKDWEVHSQVGRECGERHIGMGRVAYDGALGTGTLASHQCQLSSEGHGQQ